MDLFASDGAGIADGNRRSGEGAQIRKNIDQHNNELGDRVKQLKQGVQSQTTETAIQGAISGYMAGNGLKNSLENYKTYRQAGQTKVTELNRIKSSATGTSEPVTNDPAPSASPEGAAASSGSAPTAEEHTAVTAGEDDAGKTGSMVHKGIKTITGLSDEAIDRVGKGAGVLGATAIGGMDLYKDFEKGGIAGDNGWEKVGNVAQIGGAIADTIGVAFPPAAIIGGVLDVVGGITNEIGELFEGKSKEKKLDAGKALAQRAAAAAAPAVIGASTVVGARTE